MTRAGTEAAAELRLHGWDDEKIYFTDARGREHCVSDHPALLADMISLAALYFSGEGLTAEPKPTE
jgi:hypothetical protein